MSSFEYAMVLISIVVGLGITCRSWTIRGSTLLIASNAITLYEQGVLGGW